MPDHPTILNYATPEPGTFARNSRFVIVLLALVVPGLSSSLIRRSPKPCLMYFSVMLGVFLFFGPLWSEFLSPRRPWSDLVPFLLIYVLVVADSILLALHDRTKALSGIGVLPAADYDLRAISDQCTECGTPVQPQTEVKP